MDLYSIDKLMHETRQLAAKYRLTTGISLPVTAEIARFDVAKALNLDLIDDLSLGYDAIDKEDESSRILIKGRAIFSDSRSSPRIGQINPDGRWDKVVMVLFDNDYTAVEMYQASSHDIQEALKTRAESQSKRRGTMSVAQFKIIGKLVWTKENGIEQEIWDNQS